jgi:hypothetical protein
MTDNEIKSTPESAKSKRKYTRKPVPPPAPPPPAPPSQAVVALEADVLQLVSQRMAATQQIAIATQEATLANAKLQAAQNMLKQIEFEVQYRLSLVQQMKGGQTTRLETVASGVDFITAGPYPQSPIDGYFAGNTVGIGSIPPQPAPMTVVEGGRRVRSESAEAVRAAF